MGPWPEISSSTLRHELWLCWFLFCAIFQNAVFTCPMETYYDMHYWGFCKFVFLLLYIDFNCSTLDVLRFVCLSRLNGRKLGFSAYEECGSWQETGYLSYTYT